MSLKMIPNLKGDIIAKGRGESKGRDKGRWEQKGKARVYKNTIG